MFRTLAVVSVLFTSSLAFADDAANKARWTIVYYARQITTMKEFTGYYKDKFAMTACSADVAAARKVGVAVLAHDEYAALGGTPRGDSYEITLDRADALCAEYGVYETVGKRFKVFEDAMRMTSVLQGESSAGYAAAGLKTADACRAAVDDLIAAHVPTTFEVKFASSAANVGELKAKVCDPLTAVASKYAKKLDDADKARIEKFTKVGFAGDKLALMKRSWGFLFLAGGTSSNDPKQYAKASLIFEWTSSDPDSANVVRHTVRRYQFRGNKLVNETEKTYHKPKNEPLGNVFR